MSDFFAYCAEHSDMAFSQQLAGFAGDDWQQAITHAFTEQLGDDSLPDAVYAYYLVQDYAFIETLVNLVARTIAAAPDMPSKTVLAGFLAALTSDEKTYFLRSFDALGLSETEYLNPLLSPVSQAIIDELNDAAATGYEDAIVVLSCAEWCYLSWANAQAGKTQQRFYLKEWIDLHVLPEFEAFVSWLQSQLDSFADREPIMQQRLAERFARVARLEHEFFSEALKALS